MGRRFGFGGLTANYIITKYRMKKAFFLFVMLAAYAGTTIAQQAFIGKKYLAKINETCKMMQDGGCVLYYYCSLTFDKDSVTVSNFTRMSCSPKEREARYIFKSNDRRFQWTVNNDFIIIEKWKDYEQFFFNGIQFAAKAAEDETIIFEPSE